MEHTANRRRIFLPVQWLISPAADAVWLLGSVLVAYAMYFAFQAQLLSMAQVVLIWVFVFHGPHFWGTLSRTYADREQYQRRKRLFDTSLLWFAAGPAIVGLGLLLQHVTKTEATPAGRRDLVQLFFFLAAVWAYHHVAKQHFGFLALYRAKHREFDKADFVFHKYYLLISIWMPALIMMTNSLFWLMDIPGVYSYYEANGAAGLRVIQSTQVFFDTACTWVFWAAQVVYAGSLVLRLVRGQGINLPLLLLVLCCVPLTWIVIMGCLRSDLPGAAFVLVPVLTTYHNLQYHGLIWHYNRKRYRTAPDAREARQKYGLAVVFNRNIGVYALLGVVYTAVTIGFEHYGIGLFAGKDAVGSLFKAFFLGFAFHHYYLDSKIWHASEDAELRAVLGFPGRRPAPAPAPAPAVELEPATSLMPERSSG